MEGEREGGKRRQLEYRRYCVVVAMVAHRPANVILLLDDVFGDGEPELLLQSLVMDGHACDASSQFHVHLRRRGS